MLAFIDQYEEHVDYGMNADVDDGLQLASVKSYDSGGLVLKVHLPFEEIEVDGTLQPYPSYESCPPTSRNIANKSHEHPDTYMAPFIPYADETSFDAKKYQEGCEYLGWQSDWRDPDGECNSNSSITLLWTFS